MRIIEVLGIDGLKHKVDLDALQAKIAQDGERLSVPLLMMDAEPGVGLFFLDTEQLKGATDMTEYKVTDEMQKRVDDAYQEMCRDLSSAWRGKDYKPHASESADDAYIAACRDLQDAWKRG